MSISFKETLARIQICVAEKHGMSKKDWLINFDNWKTQYGVSKSTTFDFALFVLDYFIKLTNSRAPFSEEVYQLLRELYVIKHCLLISQKKKVSANTKALNRLEVLRSSLCSYQHEYSIVIVSDCNYCQQFSNITMSFEVALNNFPLDYDKCDRWSGCVCRVIGSPIRDGDDNLIMKE